jgi:hypothetical protein
VDRTVSHLEQALDHMAVEAEAEAAVVA